MPFRTGPERPKKTSFRRHIDVGVSTGEAFIAALVLDPRFCFTSGHQLFNTEMLNRGIIQLIKIHQKLCTQREQSSFSSTEESIQLNASYSSNTSEEMIPMNSEEIDAEKVSRFIEYTGEGTTQGVANAASESDQDIRQLILKWTLNEPRVSLTLNSTFLRTGRKTRKRNGIGFMKTRK